MSRLMVCADSKERFTVCRRAIIAGPERRVGRVVAILPVPGEAVDDVNFSRVDVNTLYVRSGGKLSLACDKIHGLAAAEIRADHVFALGRQLTFSRQLLVFAVTSVSIVPYN